MFQVREMAAVTLSGLLHCGYLQMNKQMVVSIFDLKMLISGVRAFKIILEVDRSSL